MNDPILEELWLIRENMLRGCGYDLPKLIEQIRAHQVDLPPERVVNLQKRKRPVAEEFAYPVPPAAIPLAACESGERHHEQ